MTCRLPRLLLIAAVFISFVSSNEFEIKFATRDKCDASLPVTEHKSGGQFWVQNEKYRVMYAKIFWVGSTGKINGIAACKVPASTRCSSHGKKEGDAYLFLAVTLVKSSFEDQDVHYMYNDKTFQLSKLDKLDNLKVETIHNLKNFLFVESAVYNKNLQFKGGNCEANRSKSVISGHGYFITKMNGGNGWYNMYYEPVSIGQYIFVPK
ncbi:unnamed protein product [Caenorhabditis sp. 36 PRJEB53466]|nr:unnamed protein product [Caenorhabditis sp. 36 PRJEB53466]